MKKYSPLKKYFKTKQTAQKVADERNKPYHRGIGVFKMPKGSRHAGMYAVCTYFEALNTY